MKYRDLFTKLDEAALRMNLAQTELEIALSQLKLIKSELWDKYHEHGGKEVDNGEMESKRTGKEKHSH